MPHYFFPNKKNKNKSAGSRKHNVRYLIVKGQRTLQTNHQKNIDTTVENVSLLRAEVNFMLPLSFNDVELDVTNYTTSTFI